MTWQPEIDELRRRQALARAMGGPEKLKRHRDNGKLDVRQRIDALLDPDSFHEIGELSGFAGYDPAGDLKEFTPANFICGRGRIDGRPVVIEGDDFTVRGGAADAGLREKMIAAEMMAFAMRMPLIRLIDGTGGGGSVKTLEMAGRTYVPEVRGWQHAIANMGNVPVVALALGSVAGLGAARAVTSHYSLMVKGTSQMFIAGPPVVARTGETLSKEELGGSAIHTRNGAIDDEAENEQDAFARTRRFLSYLPATIDELPPRGPVADDPERREAWLLDAIPRDRRKVYKMRPIIEAVLDQDSFFEIGRYNGRSLITGLGRVDGWPVALMAGDPFFFGGGWSADASEKVMRFVDLAQTFHLPVIHLVDCPGFVVGLQSEKAATIRHGARAMAAVYQSTVPWCSILIRKVYVARFMEEMKEYLDKEFEGSGVGLKTEIKYRGAARFDETKMRRVFHNIARNAREAIKRDFNSLDVRVNRCFAKQVDKMTEAVIRIMQHHIVFFQHFKKALVAFQQ